MIDNKYFIFGKSLASVQLAEALMTAPKNTSRKISTHIAEFCNGLNKLATLPDHASKRTMARLWMLDHVNHDLTIHNAPDFNYDTTMKNIIKYRYRLWLEQNGCLNKRELADRKIKNARESAKAEAWIAANLP